MVIGVSGVVTGKTTAQCVDVKGELNDAVTSREFLILHGTGRVRGTVTYGELSAVVKSKVTCSAPNHLGC